MFKSAMNPLRQKYALRIAGPFDAFGPRFDERFLISEMELPKQFMQFYFRLFSMLSLPIAVNILRLFHLSMRILF